MFKYHDNFSLSKIDIHNYNYIVGPHHVNGNHWTAVIIDVYLAQFQVIDPKGTNFELSNRCFQSWIQYYNLRDDASIEDWNHNLRSIKHPIQHDKDDHNCGIYVCLFIDQYVNKNHQIDFKNSKRDMITFRHKIAETLEKNNTLL